MPYRLRSRRHHWWRTTAARRVFVLLGIVVAMVVLWTAWSGVSVYRHLTQAREAASRLETALRAQDAEAAQAALDELREASRTGRDRSSGPTWAVLAHLPVLGHDADAVRRLSAVLDEVAQSGLPPLVRILGDLERGRFDPVAGRVPLDQIQALGPLLESSQESFARAETLLESVPDDVRLQRISSARQQLDAAVADGLTRLAPARRAVRLLPPMLGADGERTYLLVLQNNAEIRSTGGFPGSTFQLTALDGEIDLREPFAGAAIEWLEPPGLDLSDDERTLFTDRAATRFVDAGFIPDISRAAELWTTRYEERFDVDLDGVITADPVALSYLLVGSDPIEVDGVTLTSETVVHELLSATYARFSDPADQDAFFQEAGTQIFDRLTASPDLRTLVDGLRRGVEEGRVAVIADDPAEERLLDEGGLTGRGGEDRAAAGVYLNDTTADTGSKLSYYLDYEADLRPRCGRRPGLLASLDLRSTLTQDPGTLPEYVRAGSDPVGTEDLTIFLVGPRGGALTRVHVDGRSADVVSATYDGRPAARLELSVPAGGARRVDWSLTRDPTDAASEVRLEVTPPVQARGASVVADLGCG